MSGFNFGRASSARLAKAADPMQRVLLRAIDITEQDFSIVETLRSDKKQAAAFAAGASQLDGETRRSKHQANADGLAEAADLYPYVAGLGTRNETALQLQVAEAMRKASRDVGVRLIWGGSWSLLRHNRTAANLWAAYVRRKVAKGEALFFDPWHFELAP